MITIKTSGSLVIDASTSGKGYFKARSKESGKQKLRVMKDGYTFDYDIGTAYIFVPLQIGNGTYTVVLYKNISGNRYSSIGAVKIPVTLESEFAPYLHGNQYVDYENNEDLAAYALNMCDSLYATEFVKAMRHDLKSRYTYDYIKGVMTKPGMLPDIDRCFAKKMGICQDLAALAVAMCRIVKIPAKLVIGTFGKTSHAWCEIFYDGKWNLYDPTLEIQNSRKKKEYSKERWY